jgi:hypothetical protein
VRFTAGSAPGIQELLDDEGLRGSPARIASWVRNHIEFVPIWGALQSSATCLETRKGTAMDIASLTIALLRASGIRARYQAGTVRIPIDRAKNWLGNFASATAAASLLASGGTGAVVQVDAQANPVALRFEHVWVRAFVDYVPSQGACHVEGDTWVDIDASLKTYEYGPRADLLDLVPWNDGAGLTPPEAAERLLSGILAKAAVDSECESFSGADFELLESAFGPLADEAVAAALSRIDPSLSLRELLGAGRVRAGTATVLGGSPPFEVLARGWERAALGDGERFRVEIRLERQGEVVLAWSAAAAEVGAARFSLGFRPATALDARLVKDQLAIPEDTETQPMFDAVLVAGVNVIPSLLRDGEPVTLPVAASTVPLGAPLEVIVDFEEPAVETPEIRSSIHAGEPTVVAIDLLAVPQGVMERLRDMYGGIHQRLIALDPRFDPNLLLEVVLSGIVHAWFREVDQLNGVSSLALGCVTHRYPSAGFCGARWEGDVIFGLPLGIRHRGITVDIPGDVVILLAKDASPTKMVYTSLFQGFMGSALESQVPSSFVYNDHEPAYWLGTTDSLAFAGRLGDQLALISSRNQDCVLGEKLALGPAERAEIAEAIDRGLVVYAHASPIRTLTSTLAGYAIIDPRTGSGIFRMADGSNGANRARCVLDANPILPPAADRLVRIWGGGFDPDGAGNVLGEAALDIMDVVEAADLEPGQLATLATGALKVFSAIQNTMARYAQNAAFYDASVQALGAETARPLMGLVLLLTGLELINQIVDNFAPPPIGTIANIAGGAAISGVANAAWKAVRSIVRHQVQLEAAANGIVMPFECLELLFEN